MDELVKGLFSYIQYIVLGALAVGLLAYALAAYHPMAKNLLLYLQELRRFWSAIAGNDAAKGAAGTSRIEITRWVQIGVVIGALYYLGAVAISLSYWYVEPVRFAVLECVYRLNPPPFAESCGGTKKSGDQAAEVGFIRSMWLPLQIPRSTEHSAGNGHYLEDEALIGIQKDLYIHEVLVRELIFARLDRTTAMFAFVVVAVGLVKLLIVLVTSPYWIGSHKLYSKLIDEKDAWFNKTEGKSDGRRRWTAAKRHLIYPQALIIILAALLYGAAILSYR